MQITLLLLCDAIISLSILCRFFWFFTLWCIIVFIFPIPLPSTSSSITFGAITWPTDRDAKKHSCGRQGSSAPSNSGYAVEMVRKNKHSARPTVGEPYKYLILTCDRFDNNRIVTNNRARSY